MGDIGMELNDTQKMAIQFNKMARKKLGKKVDGFCILDIYDNEDNRSFSVEFIAYDYFSVRLNYDRGRFSCSIMYGKNSIELTNSQKWWDEANFDLFFEELQVELELRIPDKFLKNRGWL